jgi:molecular chaperone GrpE
VAHEDVTFKAPAAAGDDEITALRRERDDLYERLLRSAAEFDNYRKRTDRERREIFDRAAAGVLEDLLPIVDDLARAIAAAADSPDPALRDGIELIHRALLDLLRRRGVEPFESVGEMFDPEWHEAVASEPAGDRPDGQITRELRRGYRFGERLLRAAQVTVAKA